MHASKGLEFPIVALANLGTSSGVRIEPVVNRSEHRLDLRIRANGKQFQTAGFELALSGEEAQLDAEEMRLLYVAVARARDRLIIPVSCKGRPLAKLAALEPSLPSPDHPYDTPVDGCVLLDPEQLPVPLNDEPPAPSIPPAPAVRRALAEREGWIAAQAATRRTAHAELAVFPATRD